MQSLSEISIEEDSNGEWEVEKILKDRTRRIKDKKTGRHICIKEYLVKWVGFPNPTWEPEENLENCQELLKDFLLKQILKKIGEKKIQEKNEDNDESESSVVIKRKNVMSNKKRKSPDNSFDEEQEKDTSTISSSINMNTGKRKKKEEKEIDIDIDIKKESDDEKDDINCEEKDEKNDEKIVVEKEGITPDGKGVDIIVKKINLMKIPDDSDKGFVLNIKYKKNGKIYVDNFDTSKENVPSDKLVKYYESFIRKNFKGIEYEDEMSFE